MVSDGPRSHNLDLDTDLFGFVLVDSGAASGSGEIATSTAASSAEQPASENRGDETRIVFPGRD